MHDKLTAPYIFGATSCPLARASGDGSTISPQGGAADAAHSKPEPDIAVVSGCPEDYRTAHPATAAFVVEVAIATLGIDRAKAAVYAAADIPEYWIVIPEAQTVEILRRPSSSGYGTRLTLATADALLQPEGFAVPPLSIGQLFS